MWEFPTLNLYIPNVFIVLRYGLKNPKDKYITLGLPFDHPGGNHPSVPKCHCDFVNVTGYLTFITLLPPPA